MKKEFMDLLVISKVSLEGAINYMYEDDGVMQKVNSMVESMEYEADRLYSMVKIVRRELDKDLVNGFIECVNILNNGSNNDSYDMISIAKLVGAASRAYGRLEVLIDQVNKIKVDDEL